MKEKYTSYEVSKLIKEHIFFSKEKYNEEATFYKYKDNKVFIFNSNFSSFLSIEEFIDNYIDSTFYLYQEDKDDDYLPFDKYYRQ